MKNVLKIAALSLIFLTNCGKPSPETHGPADSLQTAHQALYNQTMDIHDEVMPRMDNLQQLKRSLQDSLSKSPGLPDETKTVIENRIQLIDSARESMMIWMRQFNPPDSVASESYGAYMTQELEKVKQVKALMLDALKK